MSIEELVNRAYTTWAHEKGTSWTGHMHAALTEQAETHAIELRAYEATVENLEQRIRELEAQRVPDVRCKCCGYLVTESEHKGCLRAADATAPEGWSSAAQWLRNNYQDHPTISALCEAMIAAGHSADRHDDAKATELEAQRVPEGWKGWRDVYVHGYPKSAQEVLFARGGMTVHGAFIGGIFLHGNERCAAALWMPLPTPLTPDEHRAMLSAALKKEGER